MEGFKDSAFNVSESVLDFYNETVKAGGNENNTDIYYLENHLKTEHSNFLALYSAVLNGLFEDNGIVLQNYGTLFVKSINIISKYIDETHFLDEIKEVVDSERTAADKLIELYNNDWCGDISKVFDQHSY